MSADYRRRRLFAFIDPWADPLGDGFQIIQSLIAVGTGGVFGKRLMGGVQKLFYLPEPHTDFIFAVIGEELGADRRDVVLLLLLRDRLARPAHRDARARQLRRVSRARPHDDDRAAGVREHQRRARPDADQGHPAAAGQQRRLVAADQPAGVGVLLNISQHAPMETAEPRDRCASLIAGGGTGGHLARASRWRARCSAAIRRRRCRSSARRTGVEARVVPREGFPLELIRVAGLKGKSRVERSIGVSRCCRSPRSTRGACSRSARPDVVIGVGGFASGPVLAARGDARLSDDAARAERAARA